VQANFILVLGNMIEERWASEWWDGLAKMAHIDWLPLPLLSRLGVPFLTTMHGRLDLPGLSDVMREFPDAPFVSISNHQRVPVPDANWIGTIQHGLPSSLLRPSYGEGAYLAFLGRLTAEKGPEDAIRIARAAGKALAHRRQDSARRDRLLQEAYRAPNRRPVGPARRRGRRREEVAVPRRSGRLAVPDRLARAVRPGDD
jgi:hypothetical protein